MSSDFGAVERTIRGRLGAGDVELRRSPLSPAGGERSVVRVDWPGGAGVVVKLYPDDAGERSHRTQATLAAQVGGDGILAIPDAIHYDPRSRILVQAMAAGDGLAARLAAGAEGEMGPAGRATAELHALELPGHQVADFDDHVTALMRPHPAELIEAHPELSPVATGVMGLLADRLRGAAPAAGPVHRDLHPRQMIVGGGRVAIVDWDLATRGDPALDVGNLVAWLETHLPAGAAARCREAFLTGYTAVAGEGVLARLDLYRAFTFLRMACKRFRRGEDFESRVRPMVTAAEAATG